MKASIGKVLIGSVLGLGLLLSTPAFSEEIETTEQLVRNCVSECRQSLFLPCVFSSVEGIWETCYDPARDPHPQGPDVESLLCALQMANHSALCSSLVMNCSLECTLEFLHPRLPE